MRCVLPLIPLILAGCAAQTAPVHGLTGSEWRFVSIDGAAPAAPEKARLGFEDGRLSASVGCNGMSGPWKVEDNRLIAGPLMQTRMFCEGPVWDQEQATTALLAAAPDLRIERDRLTLQSRGHSAELVRASAKPGHD